MVRAEGGVVIETGKTQRQKQLEKRADSPPSAACLVRWNALNGTRFQMPQQQSERGRTKASKATTGTAPIPIMTHNLATRPMVSTRPLLHLTRARLLKRILESDWHTTCRARTFITRAEMPIVLLREPNDKTFTTQI